MSPDPMHVENGGVDAPAEPLSLDEREPLVVRSLVTAAVTAVVHVGVVLGLPIPKEAEVAIGGAVDAVGLLVIVILVRPRVRPEAAVVSAVTPAGLVVTGEAAALPVGTELDTVARPPVRADLVVDPAHAMIDGDYLPPGAPDPNAPPGVD